MNLKKLFCFLIHQSSPRQKKKKKQASKNLVISSKISKLRLGSLFLEIYKTYSQAFIDYNNVYNQSRITCALYEKECNYFAENIYIFKYL